MEPLNFAAWQALDPMAAARELRARVDAMPEPLRRAALASVPEADELERRFAAAPKGSPLSGVPCLVKDMYDIGGEDTRAGSSFLPEVRPARPAGDDGAFCRSLREAGVVLAGKTHMTEFAYGLSGENAHFGACTHPRFPDRTSGGSSSGSAVAVACGVVPFAVGSDTGGSIRVPAAFCGLYGMRLSPYQAWIQDAVPLAPALDAAGWFTATAADMHRALDTLLPLSGLPPPPATTAPAASAADGTPKRGCYLEMPGLDPEVAKVCGEAAARLGPPPNRKLRTALLESFEHAERAYQVIGSLAAWETHRGWYQQFRDRYGPAIRERLERAAEWKPEQIAEARHARDRVMRTWEIYFNDYDFLVLPATPFPAQKAEELTPENRRRMLDLTAPASLGGLPVLTLPLPLNGDAKGLTTGLQVVVKSAHEPVLRSLLRQWEPVLEPEKLQRQQGLLMAVKPQPRNLRAAKTSDRPPPGRLPCRAE